MSPSGPLRVREALSRHPWLGATARTLDTLCLESRLRRYQAGERIARYGESCDAALFILEGTLELGWESEDGRWNASIWGKNLTNKQYFTSRVDLLAGFGFDYNHIGNPRTYGITLGMEF